MVRDEAGKRRIRLKVTLKNGKLMLRCQKGDFRFTFSRLMILFIHLNDSSSSFGIDLHTNENATIV